MKKILYIIIPIILLVFVLIMVFFALNHTSSTPTPSTTSVFPSSGVATSSTSITVTASNGTSIQTKDFLADPATAPDPVNNGYYYLGYNNFGGQTDVPYMIEYISSTKYFNIELLQEPLGSNRKSAETYLMEHLNITQQQMCNLNYTIGVPDSVNPVYSGENLGFSFCPGAVKLP